MRLREGPGAGRTAKEARSGHEIDEGGQSEEGEQRLGGRGDPAVSLHRRKRTDEEGDAGEDDRQLGDRLRDAGRHDGGRTHLEGGRPPRSVARATSPATVPVGTR